MTTTSRPILIQPLVAAVVARLKAHASTIAYAAKILNNVPAGTSLPYFVVGSAQMRNSAEFMTRDAIPQNIVVQIDVFSDALGDKECSTMMSAASVAITSSNLSVTGAENLSLWTGLLNYANIMTDGTAPERIVYHGVIRISFHLDPTS